MTPHATSTKDVLLSMAADGDPSAFYSLFAEYAFEYYRELRAAGRSHDEATKALMPFMSRTYVAFVTKPPKTPLKEWLDEAAIRQLKLTRPQRPSEHGTSNPTAAESAEFDARLQSRLQREYSLLRQEEKSISAIMHFGLFLRRHPVLRLPLYAVALSGLVAASYAWLVLSGSVLQIRLQGPNNNVWFVAPGTGRAVDLGRAQHTVLPLALPTILTPENDSAKDSSAQPAVNQKPGARSGAAPTVGPAASITPVKRAPPRRDSSRSVPPPSSAIRTTPISARPAPAATRTPDAGPTATHSTEPAATSGTSPTSGTVRTPETANPPHDSSAMPVDPAPAIAP